uniref:BAI1 associated protein 3 n=1 Tax=Ailuropoda melanoleuca TaxID=9646 RepID=A0A7N5KNE2_AILME
MSGAGRSNLFSRALQVDTARCSLLVPVSGQRQEGRGRAQAWGPAWGPAQAWTFQPAVRRGTRPSQGVGGLPCAAGTLSNRPPTMTTLLEIKSSVLRQVQVRPSVRRRTEGEPGCASADPQEPAAGAWKPGDGVEFFAQMRLILKKGEGRQGLPCPEVLLRSGSPAPAEPVDPNRGLRVLTPEEVEMLYEEALYTVVYRAGTMGPDQVDDEETLLGYLQQVFGISPEEHTEAIERVKKAKAPTYALKVSVMRAKNLLAKDPNGFSDPYCMLGILPASGAPQEPGPHKDQRFSFRKGSKRGGPLPAKCIQVTEVKSSTLNPVWKENFLFEIEDVNTDQLHLDIWDHDDDVSLVEACRKLNEVIGLKGMSRYFKQIVKSARANGTAGPTEDHTDDFLGCLNIPIREVPVAGEDRWFKLEPRSSASRVQGDCQLVLKLITTQRDTGMSQRGRSGFLSYMLLLGRLLQFEHRSQQTNSSGWRGELSGPAATVLCLHGAQSNLSALQLAVLHWQVSSRHHQTCTLDYGYLLGLLEDVQAHWEGASSLPQEQEESLADSLSAFSEFGLRLLRQLRDYFPATNSTAVYRLELLLKCLSKMQLFQPSFEICPFETELNMDIAAALKRGNREWYDRLLNAKSPREQPGPQRLAGLVELADAVYEDLQSCYGIYASLFHNIVEIDFFTLTFRQLERLVAEEAWVLTEELSPKMTLEVASGLFELYLTLADIQRFWSSIPGRDSRSLALAGIHAPFLPAVKLWLQVLRDQARWRLQGAVDVDTLEPVDTSSKHSSSAATASLCFSHIRELWARLAWPDPAQAQALGTQLSQDLCEATVFYTELLRKKVDAQPGAAGEPVSEPLCVVLNNVELLRKAAGQALRGLAWPEATSALEGLLPRPLLSCTQALDEDLRQEVHTVTAHLTSKMVADIRKYVQHISLSPDSIQNDEGAGGPLGAAPAGHPAGAQCKPRRLRGFLWSLSLHAGGPGEFFPRGGSGSAPGEPEGRKLQEAGRGAPSAPVLHPRVHRAVLPGQAQAEVPGAEPFRAPERPLSLRGSRAEAGGGGAARCGPAPPGRQWPERPLCDRGAGPAAPLPTSPQPENAGQEPDAAPRVRRALLLLRARRGLPPPRCLRAVHGYGPRLAVHQRLRGGGGPWPGQRRWHSAAPGGREREGPAACHLAPAPAQSPGEVGAEDAGGPHQQGGARVRQETQGTGEVHGSRPLSPSPAQA